MYVRPGGKQPVMRDAVFNGQVPDGQPKGMKLVLEERGVNTRGMNAAKIREELNKFDDSKKKVTILEQHIEARDTSVCLYPSFIANLMQLNGVGATRKSIHEHMLMDP